MITPRAISYAQNREDIIIKGFFDDTETGFYVDVGAEDPVALSVTKMFYDEGWRGINIEPIRHYHEALKQARPRDINLNVGVSDKEGTLQFREYEGSGYSTFSDSMKQQHVSDDEWSVKKHNDYPVKVKTLKALFKENNVKSIQFMKVDVEGLEYEVLKGNDWEKYRPEVLCIEANHVVHDWRKLLKSNDYELVVFDGLNEYYADKKTNRAAKFDYVKAVIYKEPIVHYKLLEDFQKYDELVHWLEENNNKVKAELGKAQTEIFRLQNELHEISTVRKHAKRRIRQKLVETDRKIVTKLSKQNGYKPNETKINKSDDVQNILAQAKISDERNYQAFNTSVKPSPFLPAYTIPRKVTAKAWRKVRGRRAGS